MDRILKKVEMGKFITTALKSILKLVKLQSLVANIVKMDIVQQALPHEESKPRSKKLPIKNESTMMRDEYGVF